MVVGFDGLDDPCSTIVAAEAVEHQHVAGDDETGGQDDLQPFRPSVSEECDG
jgi:hypothetical protein